MTTETQEALSAEELDRLEALAKAATPGPWALEDPMAPVELSIVEAGKETYEWRFLATIPMPEEDEHLITGREATANGEFIAALDPSTVLRLVAAARSRALPEATPGPDHTEPPCDARCSAENGEDAPGQAQATGGHCDDPVGQALPEAATGGGLLAALEKIAFDLEDEADNLSPFNDDGSGGCSHPAPYLREEAKKLRDLAALAATGEKAEGWRPISEAPRDGTRLLLWHRRRALAVSGRWHGEPTINTPDAYDPGWSWWFADDYMVMWDDDEEPSHFMPLPAPPAPEVSA